VPMFLKPGGTATFVQLNGLGESKRGAMPI
jgi:hypothetical protein